MTQLTLAQLQGGASKRCQQLVVAAGYWLICRPS